MGRRERRAANLRLWSVTGVLLLAWAGVGFQLYRIQGPGAEAYAERGIDQRLRREDLAADRGTIFDRHGRELAVTVDALTVYANPREITQPDVQAALLGPMAGVDVSALAERLATDTGFVYVQRQLERPDAERIAAAEFPGVYFTKEPKRVYPAGSLAAHVLGLVRVDDNRGIEGLELEYDEVLAGKPGQLLVERDPDGRSIPQGEYRVVPAEPGADLVTTIDAEIQYATQRYLDDAVAGTGAAGGSAVVMDVKTGEIYALANSPGFDPNHRDDYDRETYRNRAVTDVYEPGSTQKLITVAAALDTGTVEPWDTFEIPDELVIDDKTYTDIGEHPPVLTVTDIVTYSSNVGTILIQERLGNEAFHDYLQRFGLGAASGVDFPGEAGGVLRPVEEWCTTTCGASTAIGYRVSVTALQMAAAYGAIGNNGVWVRPHLVREIVDGDGARRPTMAEKRPVVSATTAARMRLMLAGVVDGGTGTAAAVDGYRAGGKTGTTKRYDPVLIYDHDDVVASFIGLAPIDDPRLVVAVVIDTPAGGEFGGQVAAPAFAEIMRASLHQLGVPPDA